MSAFFENLLEQAKSNLKTIVLAEGDDPRVVEAARRAADEGIAKIIVLGAPDVVASHGFDLTGITVIDPCDSPHHDTFAEELLELRKKKGMTPEEAHELVKDVLYFGTMMVKMGFADGLVAGATHTTGDVMRPALQIIKTAPGVKTVSTFFVMITNDVSFGHNGTMLFADCALNQYPDSEALSDIAISTAESFRTFLGAEPQVALLSHSSLGSARGESIDKVREAVRIATEKRPDLNIDGELQFDAAVVPAVASSKAPGSPVAGRANVLVFPDLDSGNIGYKMAQRIGKATAYGPVTQGLAKPVNDLSRGCYADDVFGVIAITAVQAQ